VKYQPRIGLSSNTPAGQALPGTVGQAMSVTVKMRNWLRAGSATARTTALSAPKSTAALLPALPGSRHPVVLEMAVGIVSASA
jgi:hypothetical protein